MTDYLIANASGGALTDVNAGGDDVPDLTVSAAITLTSTELLTVLATAGVCAIKSTSSVANKTALAGVLGVSGTYLVVNGTAAALTDVNVGGSDVPAYSFLDTVTLTVAELRVLAATTGVTVLKAGSTAAANRIIAKVLTLGCLPGETVR